MKDKIPAVITAAQIAELLGCSVQKARRWIQATGAGHKRGRWWVTSPEQLKEKFPEVHERLALLHTDDEERPCGGCLKLGNRLRESQDQVRELTNRLAKKAA